MSDYSVTNYNPYKISYEQLRNPVQTVNNQITQTNFKGKVSLDYPPIQWKFLPKIK